MAKAKKLPSGNWRVIATKTIDGIKMRKSFTASDRKGAELAAAEWVNGIENEMKTSALSLRAAYEKYINIKSSVLSPSTLRAYKSMSKNVFQDIMDLPLTSVTDIIVQREVNLLSASNASPKYVKNAYGLLSAVLSVFAPSLNLKVSLPQKRKPELYIPDDNDVKTLLDAAKGKPIEIPILLAAFGPMRRGEICALTSQDIKGNIITVNKAMVLNSDNIWQIKAPKNYSSYRNIEYPDFVIERLKGIDGNLTQMKPSAITDAFDRLIEKCNLPHFRFHDLRHYAVSTLHSINVPDKYIMARGGWATNYTMNNVYNHTLKSKADEIDNKIKTHFSNVYTPQNEKSAHESAHEN